MRTDQAPKAPGSRRAALLALGALGAFGARGTLVARAAQVALLPLVAPLAACGGGGEDNSALVGSTESRSIGSKATGTDYALDLYLPPASAGPRSELPVFYLLDGNNWFQTLVDIALARAAKVIIVGIGTSGQRSRDFVPPNSCSSGGGGQGAYLSFLRQELVPYIEQSVGGHPGKRVLFGHSHGGSFVLYALFAQAPGAHTFRTYAASDSSLGCMPTVVEGWERSYGAAYRELPVGLHLTYTTPGGLAVHQAFSSALAQSRYAGLELVEKSYGTTHIGIVHPALTDALAFAVGR